MIHSIKENKVTITKEELTTLIKLANSVYALVDKDGSNVALNRIVENNEAIFTDASCIVRHLDVDTQYKLL